MRVWGPRPGEGSLSHTHFLVITTVWSMFSLDNYIHRVILPYETILRSLSLNVEEAFQVKSLANESYSETMATFQLPDLSGLEKRWAHIM